jgi:hypothetical protein
MFTIARGMPTRALAKKQAFSFQKKENTHSWMFYKLHTLIELHSTEYDFEQNCIHEYASTQQA